MQSNELNTVQPQLLPQTFRANFIFYAREIDFSKFFAVSLNSLKEEFDFLKV